MRRMESVLVGVDFSECSRSALRQAARLSRVTSATLHVLSVAESLMVTEVAEVTSASPAELRKEVIARAREDLKAWLAEIERPKNVEMHVSCGSTIDEVLKTVRDTAPDLLVLGVHGVAGVAEGAGTLATKAVRKAGTKVLPTTPAT